MKRSFTILVVPHTGEQFRKLRLTSGGLRALSVSVALVLLAALFLGVHYVAFYRDLGELRELRADELGAEAPEPGLRALGRAFERQGLVAPGFRAQALGNGRSRRDGRGGRRWRSRRSARFGLHHHFGRLRRGERGARPHEGRARRPRGEESRPRAILRAEQLDARLDSFNLARAWLLLVFLRDAERSVHRGSRDALRDRRFDGKRPPGRSDRGRDRSLRVAPRAPTATSW